MGYPAKFAPVVLEDYVWVAMEVIVMPGTHVERDCIINPGVVLQGRVKAGSLVQVGPQHGEIRDLTRLRKISSRGAAHWHNLIITSFLHHRSVPFQYDPTTAAYIVSPACAFRSHPETNRIELAVSGRKIVYDLEGVHRRSQPPSGPQGLPGLRPASLRTVFTDAGPGPVNVGRAGIAVRRLTRSGIRAGKPARIDRWREIG